MLAALESDADGGLVAVVVGGFDEESSGVGGAGFGDRSLSAAVAGGVLAGHDPEEPGQAAGVSEAVEVPESVAMPAALSVSIPRKHRRRAIDSANGLCGQACSIARSSVERRCCAWLTAAR